MPKKFVILFERACIYSLYRRQESYILSHQSLFFCARTPQPQIENKTKTKKGVSHPNCLIII